MESKIKQSWQDFLDPDYQRSQLLLAAFYIVGFQTLKESIIDRARGIFWDPRSGTEDVFDPEYESSVLSRNKSPIYASLDWLREMGAIDLDDIKSFERIKACRNQLSHELLNMVGSGKAPANYEQCFKELPELLRKIEIWWILTMEDVDPNVDPAEIMPGRVLGLHLMFRVALEGDRSYLEAVQKLSDANPF